MGVPFDLDFTDEKTALCAFWGPWLDATRSATCRGIIERHGIKTPRAGMIGWQDGQIIVPVWGCDWEDWRLEGRECGPGDDPHDQDGPAVELRGMVGFDPAKPAVLLPLAGDAVLAPWEPFDGESWPHHPVRVHRTLLDALRHEDGGVAILDWSLAPSLIPDDAVLVTDDAHLARDLAGKFRRCYGGKRPRILVPEV